MPFHFICETVETSIWADYVLTSLYPQKLIPLGSWKSLTIPILNSTSSFDWPIGLWGLVPLHLPDIHPNPLRSTRVSGDLDSLRMQQLLPFHLDLSTTGSLKVDVTVMQPGRVYQVRTRPSKSLCRWSLLRGISAGLKELVLAGALWHSRISAWTGDCGIGCAECFRLTLSTVEGKWEWSWRTLRYWACNKRIKGHAQRKSKAKTNGKRGMFVFLFLPAGVQQLVSALLRYQCIINQVLYAYPVPLTDVQLLFFSFISPPPSSSSLQRLYHPWIPTLQARLCGLPS